MKDDVLLAKSMDFAVRVVGVYKYLCGEKKELILSKQLLRSGTSIGANVREAVYAQSRKDFVSKMSIALKEASEAEYWLELLFKTDYLTGGQYDSIKTDCGEVARLLTAIVKTAKQ